MPFTTDNLRRVTWDAAVPNEYELRWREVGQPYWSVYPSILTVPEAIFGIYVVGEPLPNVVTYIAILDIAKEYEFQVRHKCSNTNWSAWSPTHGFTSYLPCPEGGSAGFAFGVVDDPLVQNGVEIQWGYNCKGSLTYPKLTLFYKLSTSLSWSSQPYTPRDGSHMFMVLPFGQGTYNFQIEVECKQGLPSYLSAISTYGLINPLSAPTLNYKKTFRNGLRIVGNFPSTPLPIYGIEYYLPLDNITNYISVATPNNPGSTFTFLVDNLDYSKPAGTNYTIMIRLDYGSNQWSPYLSVPFVTAPENYTFTINPALATGGWVQALIGPGGATYPTPVTSGSRLLPFGLNHVYLNQVKFKSTGHIPGAIINFNDSLNNNLLGHLTDPGLNSDPGNYSWSASPPNWGGWHWPGISGVLNPGIPPYTSNQTELRANGELRFIGSLPADSNGVCWLVVGVSNILGNTF